MQEPHLLAHITQCQAQKCCHSALAGPPFWLQTATSIIPWILYGSFHFAKLTLGTEKLRAVRETATQWAVCWLSDMVDLVPISLAVLHRTSDCALGTA